MWLEWCNIEWTLNARNIRCKLFWRSYAKHAAAIEILNIENTVNSGNRLTKIWQKSAHYELKKALRETQTLRAGCSKAEPKKFRPVADTLPEGAGWPKFNQLEMVTTFTYKPSLVRIDIRNFELSW